MDFSVDHYTIKISSLTPSHLLKITKFLVKTCQFRFLVRQRKTFLFINFFVKYFRFKFIFYVKTAPPEKSHPLFSSNPLWKVRSFQAPPLIRNLVRNLVRSLSPPAEGGAYYGHCSKVSMLYLMPLPNYWAWTKSTSPNYCFSSQVHIKLRLW